MNILKNTKELVDANVISLETANKIKAYYQNKGDQSINRLFVIFGFLGAVLI